MGVFLTEGEVTLEKAWFVSSLNGVKPLFEDESSSPKFGEEPSDLSEVLSMVGEFNVKPKRSPNMDYLSSTDKESLDYAINELSSMDYKQIETYLHESVYDRVYATNSKHYTHADIALTIGASAEKLSLIRENDNITNVLS